MKKITLVSNGGKLHSAHDQGKEKEVKPGRIPNSEERKRSTTKLESIMYVTPPPPRRSTSLLASPPLTRSPEDDDKANKVAPLPSGSPSHDVILPFQQLIDNRLYGLNLVDHKSGKLYHYDFETSKSHWGPRPDMMDMHQPDATVIQQSADGADEDSWVPLVDNLGRSFEYNRKLGKARWKI